MGTQKESPEEKKGSGGAAGEVFATAFALYVRFQWKRLKMEVKTRIKNKPSCLGAVEEPKPKGLYVIIPAGNVITKNQPTA